MDYVDRLADKIAQLEQDVVSLKLQLFALQMALALAGLLWLMRSII